MHQTSMGVSQQLEGRGSGHILPHLLSERGKTSQCGVTLMPKNGALDSGLAAGHSHAQLVFIEYLLCARHFRHWGHCSKQDRECHGPSGTLLGEKWR